MTNGVEGPHHPYHAASPLHCLEVGARQLQHARALGRDDGRRARLVRDEQRPRRAREKTFGFSFKVSCDARRALERRAERSAYTPRHDCLLVVATRE